VIHRPRHFFAALVLALGAVVPVSAGLQALGTPVAPHGYPLWYQDTNNLQLELALPATQSGRDPITGDPVPAGNSTRPDLVIFDPIDPANPESVNLGVGDESFWWMADSVVNLPTGGRAVLVLGLEAAFGGAGSAANGQQIAFGRVRIRVDTPLAGTYRITYPYGQRVFTDVPADTNGINVTFDIGAINQLDTAAGFSGALAAEIGPFLTWPDYQNDPTLQVPELDGLGVPTGNILEQYIGDPNVPHIVTGSPTGNNFFRIERESPTGSGSYVLLAESTLFQVMGKVWNGVGGVAHVFPPAPSPNLFAVGAVNRDATIDDVVQLPDPLLRPDGLVNGNEVAPYPVGYPTYFQEAIVTPGVPPDPEVRTGGVRLTYMPSFDPMGITAPVNPDDPNSVAVRAGDEGFFWSSEAFINEDTTDVTNLPNGLDGILVLALEGAFGGAGTPLDGQQIVFGRVRVRVDVPVAGDYTITHPYGVEEFTDVTTADGINMTRDIMVSDPANPDRSFVGALFSNIGPLFLKWNTFQPDDNDPLTAIVTDPLLAKASNPLDPNSAVINYVGDPTIPHAVTGGLNGVNVFRIQGPNGIDVQTALFAVSGKVYDPATYNLAANVNAPVTNPDTATVNIALANNVDINVRANDVISGAATATTTAIVVAPTGGTAVVDTDGSVIYTPGAPLRTAGGTDTFSYSLTSTVGGNALVSNTSDVTVTVLPIEVIAFTQARLDTRRLRLELAGSSNFPGSTITVYRGATATGTPLGTARVGANGRWTFRATVTTNLAQVTVRSNIAFPVNVTRTLQLR